MFSTVAKKRPVLFNDRLFVFYPEISVDESGRKQRQRQEGKSKRVSITAFIADHLLHFSRKVK
jgi:hypothetical protein